MSEVKRYPGMSDLQSGIEPDKFVLASDHDAEVERLRSRLAAAEADAKRLQWLADNPRGAQIVVDGKTQDCVFWGISGHPRATLREAIDSAAGAGGET